MVEHSGDPVTMCSMSVENTSCGWCVVHGSNGAIVAYCRSELAARMLLSALRNAETLTNRQLQIVGDHV